MQAVRALDIDTKKELPESKSVLNPLTKPRTISSNMTGILQSLNTSMAKEFYRA